MRFFKYLSLFLLFTISFDVSAYWYRQGYTGDRFSTPLEACNKALQSGSGTGGTQQVTNITNTTATCSYMRYGELSTVFLFSPGSSCTAGATRVTSGSYKLSNWANEDELVSLMNQSAAAFAGSSVCANSCIHEFDYTTNTSGDESNPPIVMAGSYKSTAPPAQTPEPSQLTVVPFSTQPPPSPR
ncbi:hypothetical protein, partial [Jeotgalibaca porci]|uniref:hypothetical protein n=1 Tax=Jeotgalibaca porci TaxID=1868793 RepID=UPI0035A04173